MSIKPIDTLGVPYWKIALAAGFALVWSIIGPLLVSAEGRQPLEDASAFAGRVMGQGMAIGLVVAIIVHFAILRQATFKVKLSVYIAALATSALVSWIAHGG